jgi:hypothetical protein
VAATLVGLGISCAVLGWYTGRRASEASAAEAVGKVTEKRARQDGDLWYVDVSYQYSVDAESYRRSETRILRGKVRDEAAARGLVKQFEVGRRVPVYFNPERPGRGTLERARGHQGLLFGVGALWFVLGLLWMAYDRGRQ